MNGHEPDADADPVDDLSTIRAMPTEVGVLLLVVGIGGLLLPGPVGAPFVVMGGVILWPRAFERLELGFQHRFPNCHRQSMRQLRRFLSDINQRYPNAPPGGNS